MTRCRSGQLHRTQLIRKKSVPYKAKNILIRKRVLIQFNSILIFLCRINNQIANNDDDDDDNNNNSIHSTITFIFNNVIETTRTPDILI
jgi:hypothetical protein